MSEWTITPKRYGFGGGLTPIRSRAASPAQNAETVLAVLRGEGNAPATAAVVLNAAAALYVGGAAPTFDDAVASATEAVKSGVGLDALERLRKAFDATGLLEALTTSACRSTGRLSTAARRQRRFPGS